MNKNIGLCLWLILSTFSLSYSQVKWTVTTENAPWKLNDEIKIQNYKDSKEQLIEVFPSENKQKIDGFGGCFNERGMDALSVLSNEKRQEVIRQLFDSISGCAFNICRMPIGASDYAMDYYSLDDTPNDYKMKHFSIERDQKYLIPYIKLAMNSNPRLKVWGSPWTPPTWMKESGHYADQGTEKASKIKWEPKILDAYALYFQKFVKAYRQEGINLYAIHVQNEPFSSQIFPSCLWTGQQMGDFIKDYLGPKLSGMNVEIWLGTINSGNYDDCAKVVLSDPEAKKYITGVGYQWDGKKAIKITETEHPEVKLMQTESECGGSENNMNSARYTFGLMNHYLKAGANSYMYWNMVLDRGGLSSWGWPQNSMISIDRRSLDVKYNMEFYVMKHFAHFVKSGATRIATSGEDDNFVAFKNPDNKLILVVMNNVDTAKKYTIKIKDKMFEADVPANSFNTFEVN